ncbi:hypothetical protein AAG906_027636 [Vitis piasezkii]
MKGGGRCWFAVDSKSFEISVEVYGERCKGIIVERSRGFTSWVRFGSLSLCCLLEGWRPAAGVVSEGKGIMGGWALLAEKLRSLGVMSRDEPGKATFYGIGNTVGESEEKPKILYIYAFESWGEPIGILKEG